MSKSGPINRREWLKTTGAAVAGAVLAPRISASGAPDVSEKRKEGSGGAGNPETGAQPGNDRHYIHGFEPYPFP